MDTWYQIASHTTIHNIHTIIWLNCTNHMTYMIPWHSRTKGINIHYILYTGVAKVLPCFAGIHKTSCKLQLQIQHETYTYTRDTSRHIIYTTHHGWCRQPVQAKAASTPSWWRTSRWSRSVPGWGTAAPPPDSSPLYTHTASGSDHPLSCRGTITDTISYVATWLCQHVQHDIETWHQHNLWALVSTVEQQ